MARKASRPQTLKLGIMPYEEMKARTIAIAKGKGKPAGSEPKVWFSSELLIALGPQTLDFGSRQGRHFAKYARIRVFWERSI